MPEFVHLHCHTQYSLLDGAASVDKLIEKAKAQNMPAVAITDHGNMFGAFKFYSTAMKHGVKPILGCEFYVVEDRFHKKFDKVNKDKRYHQLLLAKNAVGYKNLSKLCSLGFMEGYYSKYPRIDKGLLKQYKEGLIASTCCIGAEVPQTFLHKGPAEAEKVFLEYLDMFGEDYYVELQRHGLKGIDQDGTNVFLQELAKKHNVKVIATNDSHYVDQDDFNAHDILLCINTGDFQSTPKGDGRGYRFGFENDQFYFKTGEEMAQLFSDIPEALENTLEVAGKIETPDLKRDILLPNYTLPEGFISMDDYLCHLTYEGAKQRYGQISEAIRERLDFELRIIKDMGFSGYFLIVQDFIAVARKLNVAVGPGRGSAAGAAVAYCTGITNIDPIRYNLLFERFLNPERVSMPDIDIDFDDEGRQKVINYVIDKYGKNQVAQIITYGTMAAKSAIRDVGRVLQYPLAETDKLAKMIPDGVGVDLKRAFKDNADLKKIRDGKDEAGAVLREAERLEGSIRQRGIHAAGVIIAPSDITEYIPVCTAKDTDLLVTQFDGKLIEDAGMLKMDFLGLKTLSILKDALENIEQNGGDKIDIDTIPLEDEKTFALYQAGDTVGTFQFESEGMRQYLRQLKPTGIEDLIAMNALYRPGPMDFIPNFISRKHGREKVEYPHELLEEILKPTYGIMVYQEQIMQTAQIIGGFSLGKADILRRAMGKKQHDKMQAMKAEFVAGAAEKDIPAKKAEEIFDVMAKFASYGFNRSHSAAYSVVAYQTAYLKANHPAAYMASVLTHNMHDIKKVVFFIDECKKMGVKVLGPDLNESAYKFSVNSHGEIRFGLGAIKGVGEAAVEAIISERKEAGAYADLFDMASRVNLRAVNKKSLESLATAGALDAFGSHRAQYFAPDNSGSNAIEKSIKFGHQVRQQGQMASQSLFGDDPGFDIPKPEMPQCDQWEMMDQLQKEKDIIGFYLSGHPLDDFWVEMTHFCNCPLEELKEKEDRQYQNKEFIVGGIVTSTQEKRTKNGNRFGIFNLEDFSGNHDFFLFSEQYLKFKHLFQPGELLMVNCSVDSRYNSDQYRLEVKNITLLREAREKLKKIELTLLLDDLNETLISRLKDLTSEHPGKVALSLNIEQPQEKLRLSMASKSVKVEPANSLFSGFEQMRELSYTLK